MSLLKYIGCDILVKGYKVTLKTWLPALVIADYIIFMLYSVFYYRNSPVHGFRTTAPMGIVVPVCCMIAFFSEHNFNTEYSYYSVRYNMLWYLYQPLVSRSSVYTNLQGITFIKIAELRRWITIYAIVGPSISSWLRLKQAFYWYFRSLWRVVFHCTIYFSIAMLVIMTVKW